MGSTISSGMKVMKLHYPNPRLLISCHFDTVFLYIHLFTALLLYFYFLQMLLLILPAEVWMKQPCWNLIAFPCVPFLHQMHNMNNMVGKLLMQREQQGAPGEFCGQRCIVNICYLAFLMSWRKAS